VREYGRRIEQDQLAPHDLRRTTAKLCRANGRELEQIQLLLGHASVQTTERYLGTKQNLTDVPNGQLGAGTRGLTFVDEDPGDLLRAP
jgi:integrase